MKQSYASASVHVASSQIDHNSSHFSQAKMRESIETDVKVS